MVVGICAMTKKSNSKPMTEILERLCKFDYIDVVIFPEEVVLEEPVEKWPLCHCLISFHSKGTTSQGAHLAGISLASHQFNHSSCFPGFPLDKAVEYAKLRNPLLINDLNMQYFIQDR